MNLNELLSYFSTINRCIMRINLIDCVTIETLLTGNSYNSSSSDYLQKGVKKMKRYRESLFLLLGIVLGVVLIIGCAAGIEDEIPPPQETPVLEETTPVEKETEVVLAEKEPVAENCDDIRAELEALQTKYEALQSEHKELNTKYNTLSADYDELNRKHNTLLEGTPDISENELEQAIFSRINKGRKDNGLDELEWTDTFHMWAEEHSKYMTDKQVIEYADQPYMQGVFRAVAYSSLDRIVNATWLLWENSTAFERNFLNPQAKYGTVAVSKSGDIYYITYFADVQK